MINLPQLFSLQPIRLTALLCICTLAIYGCSGSSNSGSSENQTDNGSVDDAIDGNNGTTIEGSSTTGGESDSEQSADDMDTESSGTTIDDPQSSTPVAPEPSLPATIRVDFNITVPAVMSDQLQVRLNWGDITTTAAWVRDETWAVSETFPANTENLLVVTFSDRNGRITLASVENTYRTGTGTSEIVQISADQFDTERWDTDNDGVSNLDELIAGNNPEGDGLPQAVQASLALVQDKTFHITWQTTPTAQSYRVLENPDGVSGFSDISGELEADTDNFSHRVALYSRVNAQYLVQSCNDQGCIDSETVMASGTLVDAIGYLKASNTGAADFFGFDLSLSADGNTLAVGAVEEDSSATGINGSQNDDSGSTGAVYVYVRTGGLWQQQAYLKASNAEAGDNFGASVSISSDGNTLVVGATGEDSGATGVNGIEGNNSEPVSGAAYVFIRSNGVWQQQAYLKASNAQSFDRFGSDLNLSGDGNTLAVGAYRVDSPAIGINPDQNDDVLSSDAGAVYVFVRSGRVWQQQAYVKASNSDSGDRFGWAVSLSADGDTLAVAATGEASAATGINGDQLNNSERRSGAVYIFARNSGLWQQQAYLKASSAEFDDEFGGTLSMSASGDTVVFGAFREDSGATGVNGNESDNSVESSGAAYVFVRNDELWQQQAYLKASNTGRSDLFATSLSLSADGNTLAVAAEGENSAANGINGDQSDFAGFLSTFGAVYVFIRIDELWLQQAYVKASVTEVRDGFGVSVSLSADGNTLAVGAGGEDSAATGINGNQNDNSAQDSGAVYLY